jgi:tetratricopeptide (TPR) repeat protein
MTPERWRRLKALFEEALGVPEQARDAFVAASADGDLRADVRRLLADHAAAEAAGFIEPPPVEPDLTGARLGAYRLEEPVGRGGMGVVYRARREGDVPQQVAVKLIGRFAVGLSLEQFRTERTILARLEHPAIARFIDAGSTPEGQPWLVMEYVRGRPITEHATARGLSVSARLELFRAVCAAVQYAHRNLVVHRDLKPSNILVTDEGAPKLLDFGIAKLLEPAADGASATVTLLRPFTPEYASPEQASGAPISTASDVYSLGVVLYELLTGVRPLALLGLEPEEALRLIATRVPAPPSAARTPSAPAWPRELAADLDTIVLSALRKEPERRYASVDALAEDVRRCLTGLPILARPDTVRYRAAKFVRRHRGGVAAATVVALALAGGVFATARQARIAEANRQRADRRFADVRRLSNRLLFEIYDSLERLPGSLATRELVVGSGLEYLQTLSGEAGDDPGLLFELGVAWRRVGDVQGMPTWSSLGKTEDALSSYASSLRLFDRLVESRPEEARYAYERAQTLAHYGAALGERADFAGARARHEQALAVYRDLHERRGFAEARYDVIQCHQDLGDDVWGQGDLAGAAAHYREALVLLEAWQAAAPDERRVLRGVGVLHQRLGDAAWARGDVAAARAEFHASLAVDERLARLSPDDAELQRDLATDASRLGVVEAQGGTLPEAEALFRRAHAIRARLSDAQPADQRASRDLAESAELLGDLLVRRGATAEGLRRLDEALVLREASLATDPASVPSRSGLGQTLALRAGARRRTGALAGAVSDLRRAALVGDALWREHAEVPELGQRAAAVWVQLADTLDARRTARAEACGLRDRAVLLWSAEAQAGRLLAEFRPGLEAARAQPRAGCAPPAR